MAFHFNLSLRIALEPCNRSIKSLQGARHKFCTARLKRHAGKFGTRIVKNNRNSTRACRAGNIRSFATFERSRQAFAENRVGIFTRDMEASFAIHVRRDDHLFSLVLPHKRELFLGMRNVFFVRVSHVQHSVRLVRCKFACRCKRNGHYCRKCNTGNHSHS